MNATQPVLLLLGGGVTCRAEPRDEEVLSIFSTRVPKTSVDLQM